MNLIESYKEFKEQKEAIQEIGTIENLIFITKEEYQKITEQADELGDLLFDIHQILSGPFNESEEKFQRISEISEKLSKNKRKEILYYMIENGIDLAPLYANHFNIETKNIHINLFLEGIRNGGENLIFSDNYINFLNGYKNPKELIQRLGKEGFIEQFDYFVGEDPDYKRINSNDFEIAIKNFEERYRLFPSLLDKLNTRAIYDWDSIIENTFENYIEAKQRFKILFDLSKEELEKLKKLKDKVLFDEYLDEIDEIKERLEDENFSLLKEIDYNKIEGYGKNKEIFNMQMLNISLLKNPGNKFHITFLDVAGKLKTFILTSSNTELLETYNSYYDINDFKENIYEELEEFIYNLEKNDLDFTVIITKSNGIKDGNDDENSSVNNINYVGKRQKIA